MDGVFDRPGAHLQPQRSSSSLHRNSVRTIFRRVPLAASRDALLSPGSDDRWLAWDDPGSDALAEPWLDPEMRDTETLALCRAKHPLGRGTSTLFFLSRPPRCFVSHDRSVLSLASLRHLSLSALLCFQPTLGSDLRWARWL